MLTWSGGNDLEKLMDFYWQTGVSIYENGNWSHEKKSSFFENYPQNYHPNRHCIQLRSYVGMSERGEKEDGLRYRNVQCGLLRDFICEGNNKSFNFLTCVKVETYFHTLKHIHDSKPFQ